MNPTCSVDECEELSVTRGWCRKHYTRWQRHGDPTVNKHKGPEKCSVDGCENPHCARGWCRMHWGRWQRHGNPLVVKKEMVAKGEGMRWLREAVKEETDECVKFPYGKSTAGYGVVRWKGKAMGAHVAALGLVGREMAVGHDRETRHSCDTPACVNPRHLEVGPPKKNAEDRVRAGTAGPGTLTERDVTAIREMYASGDWIQRELAEKFGISGGMVNKIVNRRAWRHVP